MDVREVLQDDCKIRGLYINGKGETCAIGALAEAAGYDISKLYRTAKNSQGIVRNIGKWGQPTKWEINEVHQDMAAAITKTFGLTANDLYDIQFANDDYTSRPARVAAVLRVLE